MAKERYNAEDRAWAKARLVAIEEPLDSLPYTKRFDELFVEFNAEQVHPWNRPDFWKFLLAVRKQGLGRRTRPRTAGPELSAKQRARLKELMPAHRGEVDRLPYTRRYDDLYSGFSRYVSKPITKNAVWLACLRIAKQSTRKAAKPFLKKALRRACGAINAFNQIGGDNRLDDSIICLHHALEMILKGALVQCGVPIEDIANGHLLQFKPCVSKALHHESARFISHADKQTLLLIDATRGDAYHELLELDETEAFTQLASGIEIFQKILWDIFWTDLAEELGSFVLPISTIPLVSSVMLLDRKKDQVKALLRAGDRRRAAAAARSLAILDKAIAGGEDARVTSSEVDGVLSRLEEDEEVATAFPKIAAIPITQAASGATIFIAAKRGGEAAHAIDGGENSDEPVVAVHHQNYANTHPFRFNDVVERTGISTNRVLGIVRELGLKERDDCFYEHGPARGTKIAGWSPKAIDEIRKFADSYDGELLELYRKHVRRSR